MDTKIRKKGINNNLSFMDTKVARYHRLEKGVRKIIIGEKKCIGYFHVSEHIDHFKAIQILVKKPEIVWFGGTSPPPLFGKKPNYFRFFHLTASLTP